MKLNWKFSSCFLGLEECTSPWRVSCDDNYIKNNSQILFLVSGVKNYLIVQAIDINENANATYKHNFPDSKCLNKNIQKLKISELQNVNSILMSPPCQPFTRQGNFKDTEDRRCEAFQKVCSIIKENKLSKLNFILMENVMGFEKSKMRDEFIASLETAGFFFREFILSPKQVGVANTRHRYYLIARRNQDFSFGEDEIVSTNNL